MRTEVMHVTPAMARDWLKKNTANRPLRNGTVSRLRAIWDRDEWRLTHQGIAFGQDGVLKDGQHRLTFISELPDDAEVPLLVTHGMASDVFGVIDVGVKRTMADEFGVSASLAAVATFMSHMHDQQRHRSVTAQSLAPFVEFARPYFDDLVAFCNSQRQIWSSSPVKAAAIIQMARGHNADFVKTVYRSLVLRDIDTMTPTAQALFKQVMDGKAGSARSVDLFVRALRVFDSIAPSARKIQVKDLSEVTAEVRQFLEAQIGAILHKQKKAPPKRGNGI